MIRSMTGYGEIHYNADGVSYSVEIKSLNNRYFKASIKLPEQLSVFESEVEKLLRSRLTRGTVSYNLRLRDKSPAAAQEINVAALESYLHQMQQVETSGLMRIDLAAILQLPGVCQPPEIGQAAREQQWAVIEKISHEALDHLIAMREVEGRTIREDLLNQCRQILEHIAVVAQRAPVVVQEYHQKLLQRVNELIAAARLQLQLDDLKREVAVYAERCDINEEISRLKSHLDQFESLCDRKELAGRKLDFLAQELLRETNTIGSKANDATVAHHIVEMKGMIDRIKEQVQNVE